MRVLYLLTLLLLIFSGCSTKHEVTLHPYKKPSRNELSTYQLKSNNPIAIALYDEYKKWHGTPYCYGGTTIDGVDCSALVQTIFRDALGLRVPRATEEQAKIGYKISKKEIEAGDIILFKTGWSSRHSGIYLENGNFINTSTKHGVTLSNLNNPYWKEKYWQTRRVLP